MVLPFRELLLLRLAICLIVSCPGGDEDQGEGLQLSHMSTTGAFRHLYIMRKYLHMYGVVK
jgi:hypothetical protein